MSKKVTAIGAVVLVLSLVVGVASAQVDPGTSTTNIVVQNTSTTVGETATVIVQYYDTDGNLDYTNSGVTIEPKAVKEIKTEDETLPDGWDGSAVMSSDRSVAAIVSVKNTNVPGAADGLTQAAYNGSSEGATTLYYPSLFGFQYITSRFTVQNTESTAATVYANFYNRSGTFLGQTSASIPAYSQKTYDMSESADLPSGWPTDFEDGSVVVTSTNKLAGAAITSWSNGRSAGYQALTDNNRGTTLYAPSHFRFKVNATDTEYTLFSALNIQNTSATASANITLTYTSRGASSPSLVLNYTIPPLSAAGFNTKNGGSVDASLFNPLTTDWDGGVEVASDQQILGIGITNWGTAVKAGNYAMVTPNDGAETLFLPAQYRLDWGSGWAQWSAINLQNVGDTTISASDLTIEYIDTDGNTIKSFTGAALPGDLASGGSLGMNTRNGGDLDASDFDDFPTVSGLPRFIGGIYVSGPAGSQMVAVANIIYNNRASVYNAFPGQ